MTTTTITTATITPEEAVSLWDDATYETYNGEPDDEGYTVDYLDPAARRGGALEAKFIAAYEATKHIAYADMPAYDDSDMWNPWNAMNDLFIASDFADCVDIEALQKAYDWAEGWMDYTNAT